MSMRVGALREVAVVPWECWVLCTDAVGREVKRMVAIREGCLVVIAPPGDSISFTTEQLEDAEEYVRALSFGLEMLRRQAADEGRDPQPHGKRWRRGRGGS